MKQLFVLDRAPHWVAVTSIASAMVLSACATSPETAAVAPPPSFQSLMDSADAAQKQNLAAQAMAFYEQAAKADPASKQPWLRMAQSHFDSRSYGQAITASQEALHRDNTDVTAKSLMAASGLRVSADALEQLRQANAVGGSTKTEAQVLVRIMRDAVGEAIFPAPRTPVPPVAADTAPPKPAPIKRRVPAPAAAPTTPAVAGSTTPPPATAATPAAKPAAAATPPAAPPAKPSNPFDILKKN